MKDEIYDWRHPHSKMHEKQAVDTKNNTKKKLVSKMSSNGELAKAERGEKQHTGRVFDNLTRRTRNLRKGEKSYSLKNGFYEENK